MQGISCPNLPLQAPMDWARPSFPGCGCFCVQGPPAAQCWVARANAGEIRETHRSVGARGRPVGHRLKYPSFSQSGVAEKQEG